ncbi:hypothetical protein Ciccas_001415 [Cichlidogyrus casuarinus]|uniref:Uncharacterized protein n=1 Tax=Cichlidogyrus casuarinus TaxID=1844966 RepID=A0ABD2QK80_9PLAT
MASIQVSPSFSLHSSRSNVKLVTSRLKISPSVPIGVIYGALVILIYIIIFAYGRYLSSIRRKSKLRFDLGNSPNAFLSGKVASFGENSVLVGGVNSISSLNQPPRRRLFSDFEQSSVQNVNAIQCKSPLNPLEEEVVQPFAYSPVNNNDPYSTQKQFDYAVLSKQDITNSTPISARSMRGKR